MLKPYLPIVLLGALAAGFAVFSVVLGAVIGPKRYNRAKVAAYESGIEPESRPDQTRFPVKFYLTAMLFIVFDIEIIFLYPWAVAMGTKSTDASTGETVSILGVFGLVEMVIFIATVFVAYTYVWRRGGLEWD